MVEEFVRVSLLLDFYGPLLTERQRLVCRMYYDENFTLAEIGTEIAVSRQAVHDTLRRSQLSLESYENRLGLVRRFYEQQAELREIRSLLDTGRLEAALPRLEKLIL